jgi:glycine/D-amino acid oxidase-like deaminating enzyme
MSLPPDIAVIGGGLVGASLTLGLVRTGATVTLLDEGSTFCPHGRHGDPPATLRALHRALHRAGVRALRAKALRARANDAAQGFRIERDAERIACRRVVPAAGLDKPDLCEPLGLQALLRPQRGQIKVTERSARFLDPVCHTVRQSEDRTVMLDVSKKEVGFDTSTAPNVIRAILSRAVRCFPYLAKFRLTRSRGALRVMTQEGQPTYQISERHPGASLATWHSGVTLAAAHAGEIASALLENRLNDSDPAFSPARFETAS